MRLDRIAGVLTFVLLAGLSTAVIAKDIAIKHSGTIISADQTKGLIVLAEVGPWRHENGKTVITRRVIGVTDTTDWVDVRRSNTAPSGFRGDFVEAKRDRWALAPGDFVTIDCLHKGRKLVAARITVLDLRAP